MLTYVLAKLIAMAQYECLLLSPPAPIQEPVWIEEEERGTRSTSPGVLVGNN
jgi:hypothetical protein